MLRPVAVAIVCGSLCLAAGFAVADEEKPADPAAQQATEPATDAGKPDAEKPAAEKPAPPETHTATAGPIKVDVKLQGVFEAEQMTEVVLRPDVYSRLVVEKAVPQGTQVSLGDPLLWLETDKIDDQIRSSEFGLEQARLSMQQAELELASLEASVPLDLRAAERLKSSADKDLEQYLKVGADMALRSAQESLKSSEYNLEYAEEELAQLEQMYKADDLTEETEEIILKRARRDVEQYSFFLDNARVRHERTINETLPRQKEEMRDSTERAAISLQRAQATLPRSLQERRIALSKLRFSLEQSEKEHAQLLADRELMITKAPASGVVYYGHCDRGKWPAGLQISKQLRQGGAVQPNQVIMTIVSSGPAFVRVDVSETDLRRMKVGIDGIVRPTAFPKSRLLAKVAAVDPIPISNGTFDGRVSFDLDEALPIVPGMNCEVVLTAYMNAEALTVPASAIFAEELDETAKYVYVYKEGADPEKRTVKTGEVSGDKTEILSGLAAGDKILRKKPEKKPES